MADDRTPHPINLTEPSPDDVDVQRARQRKRREAEERRPMRLDPDAVAAAGRKVSEEKGHEGPGSKLV